MKKTCTLLLFLFFFSRASFAQQVSLYDSEGEAVAYINFSEDATIFFWDGKPAAFLEKDEDDICIFGFNGTFLGWYESGIIYDKKGYPVGAKKGVLNMNYRIEKIKGIQRIVGIKPITPISPIKPIWRMKWGINSLERVGELGD